MVKIKLIVMGFASHTTWAEGFQRASVEHDVHVEVVPCDRWKFRLLVAAAELEHKVEEDDDIVVVDGMLDVTVLVALLKSDRPSHCCPKVFVYFHENQLTTPFTSQDRDKKQQTHWHYGMAHWRSLQVADGCIFNSQTHLDAFSKALPRVINEQCPRDSVQWHLSRCHELLSTKCAVLRYGLELDELYSLSESTIPTPATTMAMQSNDQIPVILWNARLEEDKDPATFLDILHEARRRCKTPFRLIVLGTDPSKEQIWTSRIRSEFADQLLYLGWCQNRQDYAKWLRQASIVISTAQHETFGISIVESVFCGALPLLPNRLSYPEIFSPNDFPMHFYETTEDCVVKLLNILEMNKNDPISTEAARDKAKDAISQFRWSVMGKVYDQFFSTLGAGEPLSVAESKAKYTLQKCDSDNSIANIATPIVIQNVTDPRVQLYRPKSLRDHREYNRQLTELRAKGIEPTLHGGRRAMVRMLEAISLGAKIQVLSFLSTRELAAKVLDQEEQSSTSEFPTYIAPSNLLCDIRGQKLNSGDAILSMIQFPMVSDLEDLILNPPILILEDVRNAENVGSILRTAFCLGITSVIASRTSWSALKDSRAARCSMGTMYYHRFFQSNALDQTIQTIRSGGDICVYGVEIGQDAKPVQPHGTGDRKWAAVMGNEDLGLTQEVRAACDQIVFVPQAHGDSLNVGHAAAITMFELGRGGNTVQHDGRAACK